MCMRDGPHAQICELIFQVQDHQVAGADTQIGGLVPLFIDVAIANRTIGISHIADCQLHVQHAVFAVQVRRLFDDTSGHRAWTYIFCGLCNQGLICNADSICNNRYQRTAK